MEQKRFSDYPISLKCCVIIPTYNNCQTLQTTIEGVFVHTESLIIVNDGSTDTTAEILKRFSHIEQIHIPQNMGKGNALREGFKKALDLGYEYAITIDSDGQHFPTDLPKFLHALQENSNKNVLFIGARNMAQEGVPKKSSFGNKFSNFWFWVETGSRLKDTQSGFRLYPISIMPKKWFTTKFEFEIESIVRSAWKGIPVVNIPIQIKYDQTERVSHFRPFKDFTRISLLNTVLVIITLLYIIPRSFFRLFKKKSFREFIKEDIIGSHDSPKIKSISLALGVFIGILPIWGFQTIVVLFLAVAFRLNKLLAFAASNISIPPMIPFIVIAALKIGSWVLNSAVNNKEVSTIVGFKNHLFEYLIGSVILATVTALVVGFTSYFFLKQFKKNKEI